MTRHFVFAFVSLLALGPVPAWAHAVGVEAKRTGDKVRVEAFFDDDTPASGAKIMVIGEDGKQVAEGKSDAKGAWSFPTPAPGKYRISVDAGPGHAAKTTITIPPAEKNRVPAGHPEPAPVGKDGKR